MTELIGIRNWIGRGIGCLLPAMQTFRGYQTGLATITDVDIKTGDQSLATIVDHDIETMVLTALGMAIPEVAVFSEEGGGNAGAGQYYMYLDPLDGTREMTTETALSVIILGLMQRHEDGAVGPNDLLVGAIIAEPSTGRIWAALQEEGCYKFIRQFEGVKPLGPCKVWEGPLSTQTSVFVDSSQGFINTRDPENHRQMLTDAQNAHLYSLLNPHTHVRVLGPNGQIEALVANGARGVAGSMSLALGWPWDAVGALLVSEAGGALRAFSTLDGHIRSRNPFCPNSYDYLITGNNPQSADWLSRQLVKALLEA